MLVISREKHLTLIKQTRKIKTACKNVYHNASLHTHSLDFVLLNSVEKGQNHRTIRIQMNSIQFNSIQFNSIQFNSIQFNSIQKNDVEAMCV